MEREETIKVPEYDALIDQLEAAKAKVREQATVAVAALFKAFFAKYPAITAIKWTQYTPYFNDGEPCEFSTNEPYACTKTGVEWPKSDDDAEPEDDGELFQDAYDLSDGPTEEALRSIGRAFSDEVFLAAFGDHAQIIATPAGFHVTEYSHD